MRFFITGATGYIGTVVAEKAIAQGHTVHGLSRSEAGDAKLNALGVIPVRGDLSSIETLSRESAAADVVIHCAFSHDFVPDKLLAFVNVNSAAITALAEGLKGSGKPLIISSGAGGFIPDPNGGEIDETTPEDRNFPMIIRTDTDLEALRYAREGVRVSVVRIAPFVYGRGGSSFVPKLIEKAHALGVSWYVGDGSQKWTTMHVDDAASLHLALVDHPTGGHFIGSGSTDTTAKEVAEAIGTSLKVSVRSISKEEAVKEENWGPLLTMVTGTNYRASSKKAQSELDWKPTGVDLQTDIAHGSYTTYAAKLGHRKV